MAGWVLFPYGCQGFFGYPWHAPDILAYEVHRHQCFLLRITRIASVYEMCIQWRLYEAAQIWKLKAPLGIGRELFCLQFLLWTVCVVSSPKFRPLYKAPWDDHLPHPLALELCGSSKLLPSPWTKKMSSDSWALQLRQREQRLKTLIFFNRTRKSTFLLRLGTVASADRAKFLVILQTPIKNVQELAKEEGKKVKRSWGKQLRYQREPSPPL